MWGSGVSKKPTEKQGVVHPRNLKKSSEAFVPWKKPTTSCGRGQSDAGAAQTESACRGMNIASSNFSKSRSMHSQSVSLSGRISAGTVGFQDSRGSPVGQGKHATVSMQQFLQNNGEAFVGRAPGPSVWKATASGFPPSQCRKEVPSTLQSPMRNVSATAVEILPSLNSNYSNRNRSPLLERVSRRDLQQSPVCGTSEDMITRNVGRTTSSSAGLVNDKIEGRGRWDVTSSIEDDEGHGMGQQEEDYGEDTMHTVESLALAETEVLPFYSDDLNENDMTDNEDKGEAPDAVDKPTLEDAEGGSNFQEMTFASETERRRGRRQERAWREREGDRRRKEGLPRNFLLVDEYTKKPYGVGVGDWRKEVMLLSRKLDPAIGNINVQPEGAVSEIAEWIQHTWEYSSPMKFEYVKDVVARGVTLRRADIWKKIRNNEPKPHDVSDGSWRTLRRQLDNPASIRKSENCSKANASRVNYGRTGPSGEVGVRQRLRRILRRSPDPEEIRFEMARDKGYGGQYERKKGNIIVVHGNKDTPRSTVNVSRISGPSRNLFNANNPECNKEGLPEEVSQEMHMEVHSQYGSGDKAAGGDVLTMSDEQIAEHPFVQMMMQRLESLEKRQFAKVQERSCEMTEKIAVENISNKVCSTKRPHSSHEVQDGANGVESEGKEATRKSRRHKKKAKHG